MADTIKPAHHAWDHTPGGEDPIPTLSLPGFHGFRNSTITCSSGSDSQISWDSWKIDDATYFTEGTLSGGKLTDFKLNLAGWYAISCKAWWAADPASGFAGIAMIHDDTDISEARDAQGLTYPVNFSSAPAIKFSDVRYFPTDYTQTQTLAWVDRLEFWIVQNSGVNRTLNNAYVDVVYLGPRPA